MSADLAIDQSRARGGADRTGGSSGGTASVAGAGGAADAAHLAPDSLPRWRALLEFQWRERLERVTELSMAYYDAEEAGARAGSGHRTATIGPARPLLREAVAERRALADIEAALTRLSNGSYGRCERCRGPVAASRLTRIPQARYCAACER
jgi:RNA polymerase-binding transcription factor DksA